MKKALLATLLIFIISGIFSVNTNAQTSTPASQLRRKINQEIKQKREDFRENIKELKQDRKDATASGQRRDKIAKLIQATITAINGSVLTVIKDGKSFTVNTSSVTKFRRHFWGKSNMSEMSVGNIVNVWGKWTNDTQTVLDAKLIRNMSIMKRYGVFFGKVKSKTDTSFVIESLNRGNQTVFFTSTTKFIDRKEKPINFADIKIGDKVRVKGMWDKSLSKITEASVIKDFSLPVKKVSPTLTPSITTAPTPS
jgi:cell division protein FtsB